MSLKIVLESGEVICKALAGGIPTIRKGFSWNPAAKTIHVSYAALNCSGSCSIVNMLPVVPLVMCQLGLLVHLLTELTSRIQSGMFNVVNEGNVMLTDKCLAHLLFWNVLRHGGGGTDFSSWILSEKHWYFHWYRVCLKWVGNHASLCRAFFYFILAWFSS